VKEGSNKKSSVGNEQEDGGVKTKITAQGALRKLTDYESGYHGHKTGSVALGMDGAEPDEFYFRKKHSTRAIDENEKKVIKKIETI
jgi:hypothetical protein